MIKRLVQDQILERLRNYPAVGLVGPRQSGKTTLAKSLGGAYFDLEQESERLRLDIEWEKLVAAKDMLILDRRSLGPMSSRVCGEP